MGVREARIKQDAAKDQGFRWRGGEVSRVEGFSDAVFGFALTLLVVSLEVPKTFTALLTTLRGFVAFGICFALLYLVWERHYTFFRRYGLVDGMTLAVNGVLLFVVLLYVYPLKFLFTMFIDSLMRIGANSPSAVGIAAHDIPLLFMIYGLGFAAIFGLFALLHFHAWQQREALELNTGEQFITRASILRNLLMASIGLLSAGIACVIPLHLVGIAGYIYLLVSVVETLHGHLEGEGRRKPDPQPGDTSDHPPLTR